MFRWKIITVLLVGGLLGGTAVAATKNFREGGGSGYVNVTFDDTQIENYYPDSTFGNNGSLQATPDSGYIRVSLTAIKDLFTQLPKTSGGNTISISSAILHLTRYNEGSSSDVVKVYRCTTNWLPGSAGTNENDISWNHADISANTHWASGSSFSSSDYDSSICETGYWVSNYEELCNIDITDVIAKIYDVEVNRGLVIRASATISYYSSEQGTASKRPSLEITYTYPPTSYTLTVNSGTGGGNYTSGTVVNIAANTAPSGKAFDKWTGNTSYIADVNASSTTLTMPAAAQTITATYVNVYLLTVNTGTGGGSYKQGAVVNIVANAPASGKQFDKWTGNTSGIANVNASSTTLTMPAAAQTITATYVNIYVLTVNSGTGSGTYTQGTVVNIVANAPASGKQFDKWTGNTSGIANVNASSTTLTMPTAAQTITATYVNVYVLTVNSGTGSGSYTQGTVVNIVANTAPSGTIFSKWTGNTSGIANVNAASTTLTMPAAAQTITATYVNIYTLTVNSGTGSGTYTQGTVVNISANAPASGKQFDKWTGNTSGIANVNAASTTLTMPAAAQTITATYVNIYVLVVNSGTGSGSYTQGTVVNIAANTAPSGKTFDKWTGNTSGIANVNAASTTLTMPAAAQTITATYKDITYTLTVNSGSGDGDYTAGTVVNITADTAPSGKAFDKWTGNTSYIANVNASSTTLTMPAAAQTVTATYKDATTYYTLTVNGGTGGGSYTQGTVVNISANTAASGQFFDRWTGNTSGIANINASSTTLTMPAANQTITSTYASVAGGLVSRFTFDIDARDSIGSNNGTLTGGALVSNDAARGSVLNLDGTDDYVSLPTGGMAAGRSELTLSMWVRPDTWASGRTVYDEYAYQDGSNWWQFTLLYGGYYTRDSSTGVEGARDNDVALSSLTTGSWQHLAVTYSVSGAKKQVFLNGVPGASSTTSIDALTSTRTGVGIGYACDGTYFDGLVDDVRLYNRALNTTEIAVLAGTTTYTLTVNSGTGGGTYAQGTVVNISADAPPSGKVFDKWTGNTSGIANVNASSTTLTMPAANQTVTATYVTATTYALTVNSGTGDGNYTQGTVVNITADTAPSGYQFDKWIGNTAYIANVNASSTTLTMPAANQTVTATYVTVTTYTLTVNSGSGDGNYTQGTVVNISADAPPSGKVFDKWVGNTSYIANVNASSTTLTMPAAAQTITATYVDAGSGPSISGTSGTWSHGNSVTINGSGFGTKSQAAPLVWDTVSSQYVNGTNQNAYSGLSDGNAIPSTIWPEVQHVNYYTSRTHRNSYVTAHYAGISPSDGHVTLGTLSAPSTQKSFYLSFYRKVKNGGYSGGGASPGGGDGSTKVMRICGTDLSGTGTNFLGGSGYGVSNSTGDQGSWVDVGGETTWIRWEFYVGVNKQWFDAWKEGHYHLGSYSGAGGSIEWRPSADWRFRSGLSGYQFDAPWLPTNIGIVPGLFGYDDGHGLSSGQEVDLSELYYDNTQARVEISDQSTWNDSPSSTAHREVQGRLTSWSGAQIQLVVYQGGFSSLSGKYLYVIDADGNANVNGYAIN